MDTLYTFPEGTRYAVTAPVTMPEKRRLVSQLDVYLKGGYSRLLKEGNFVDMNSMIEDEATDATGLELVVDRSMVKDDADERSRLAESAERSSQSLDLGTRGGESASAGIFKKV